MQKTKNFCKERDSEKTSKKKWHTLNAGWGTAVGKTTKSLGEQTSLWSQATRATLCLSC